MIQMNIDSKVAQEGKWKKKKKDKTRQDDGNKKRMQNEQTEVVKLQDLWYNSLMSNCMHDLQRKLTHFMICWQAGVWHFD